MLYFIVERCLTIFILKSDRDKLSEEYNFKDKLICLFRFEDLKVDITDRELVDDNEEDIY